MKNKRKNRKTFSAFSFIEVMLSIFMLSVGIISVISIMVSGIEKTTQSRRYFVASLLSQEGVELVRNIRDMNARKDQESFLGITAGWKIIDFSGVTLYNANSSNVALNLYGGYYRNTTLGTKTLFSRKILIQGTGDTRTVYSTVVWEDGSFPSSAPTVGNCNLSSKCVFTKIILNRWREQ